MWPNPQFPVDLVTFTEEIRNEKLYIFCAVQLTYADVLREKSFVIFTLSLPTTSIK